MGIFRDTFGRWMFPPAFKDAEQAYAVRILNIVLGAWGFVQKPFATEDLIRQIADVLQKRPG